jgi:hypothetical protein
VAIRTGNAAREVAISLHGVRPFEHLLHLGLKLPFQRAPRDVSAPTASTP